MKKMLFLVLIISFNVFCMEMEKTVYFNMIHENNPSIIAKVSEDGIKLIDSSWNEVNSLAIPLSEEEDGFKVVLKQNSTYGIISIYNENNLDNALLKFSIEKINCYNPATVKFLEIEQDKKAVLYRPSMG